MRTDVIIDRRKVKLPYSGYQGYQKFHAQFGDWITWKGFHTGQTQHGRIIGRIKSVQRVAGDLDMRGWLVVASISLNLTNVSERWVDPSEVISCIDPRNCGIDLTALWMFLSGDSWRHFSDKALREWVYSGRATP